MKRMHSCRWHRFLPVLAAFAATASFGQGIIHVQAPIANPDDALFPWNALGTGVGPDFPIVINGQAVLTFSSLYYGLRGVVAQPSTISAIIGEQPFPIDPGDVWCWPLAYGTEIGPDLANGGWIDGSVYSDFLLTAATASGLVEEPFLTSGWFTGTDPADTYLGFSFQEGGDTYYGWAQVGCPIVGGNTAWIYGYAYSTIPNMPIFAGQVPEPSTWTLLGMGGLTFFILRRKASRPLP